MATDYLYYPGQTLKLGVDGYVPFASPTNDDCCAYSLCMSEVQAACSMLDLLPTGPMWDGAKAKVRQQIVDAGGIPVDGFDCASMVTYTAYLGLVLKDVVDSTIGVSVRESSPYTAVNYDRFLDKLNWKDCFRSACRSPYIAKFSPYEVLDPLCRTTEYCPTNFPVEFENALKHAIMISLTRAQRGFIRNLAGFNWVIAPLGAVMAPTLPYPQEVQDSLDDVCVQAEDVICPQCFCAEATFTLTHTGTTLPGAPTVASFCGNEPAPVAAQQTYTCMGNSVLLYPGIIAAECIVRAFMPGVCPNVIYREDGMVAPVLRPPVAVNDFGSTPENVTLTGNVLTNDSDPDGDPLTVTEFTW